MKKLITVLGLGLLFASCSSDSVQEERPYFFGVGEEVTITIKTDYKAFNETFYDLNSYPSVLIYQSSKDLEYNYKFQKKGAYKFTFTPTEHLDISNTTVIIHNKTTNKNIDVNYTQGCLTEYSFQFAINN